MTNNTDDLNETDKGISLLIKAAKMDPSLYQAYHKIGFIYLKQGLEEEALPMLTKAIEINPDAWEVYRTLGLYYRQEGDHQKVIENYKMVIKLNPAYAQGYSSLADIYLKTQQIPLAIKYYDKAKALGHVSPSLFEALKPYR